MTWVKSDDQMSIHRKVAPLSDGAYRLMQEAREWASRNLTDGRIAAVEFPDISRRATRKNAAELVQRRVWHLAEDGWCGHEKCPTPGVDGWVIHDYLDYNPSCAEVVADRARKAERQRKWLAKRRGERQSDDVSIDTPQDRSTDGPGDRPLTHAPSPSPSPPRREAGTGSPSSPPPAAAGDRGAAGDGSKPQPTPPPCRRCGNATTSTYHRNVCRAEELNPA